MHKGGSFLSCLYVCCWFETATELVLTVTLSSCSWGSLLACLAAWSDCER